MLIVYRKLKYILLLVDDKKHNIYKHLQVLCFWGTWGYYMGQDPISLLMSGNGEAALEAMLEEKEQGAAVQMTDVSDRVRDRSSKKAEKLPKEEGAKYVEQAQALLSEMKRYGDPHFVRNFFEYLFNKTKDMEDQLKRRVVLVAYSVYDSTQCILDEKTGLGQNVDSLYALICPETRFVNLGFDRHDQEKLREALKFRIKSEVLEDPRFDREFYDKETVAEVTELITDINPLA